MLCRCTIHIVWVKNRLKMSTGSALVIRVSHVQPMIVPTTVSTAPTATVPRIYLLSPSCYLIAIPKKVSISWDPSCIKHWVSWTLVSSTFLMCRNIIFLAFFPIKKISSKISFDGRMSWLLQERFNCLWSRLYYLWWWGSQDHPYYYWPWRRGNLFPCCLPAAQRQMPWLIVRGSVVLLLLVYITLWCVYTTHIFVYYY